jgi:uncharacterized membrane protein YfbV (UPF0208 family)
MDHVEEVIEKWAYNIAHRLNEKAIHGLTHPSEPYYNNVFKVTNKFFVDLDKIQEDALNLALNSVRGNKKR